MGKLNTVKNGKGSQKRPTKLKSFNQNYEEINWSKKPVETEQQPANN